MNSNKPALLLPKLKETQIQKDDHSSSTKLGYQEDLKNLYGSKINRYHRMLKSIADHSSGPSTGLKPPEVSKIRPYRQNLSQGIEPSHNDSIDLNQRRLKVLDQQSTYSRAQALLKSSQQVLTKAESESKLHYKRDRINLSYGNENINEKSREEFQFVKGEINRFENMGRNRRLIRDPLTRYSANSTPIKLAPIMKEALSQANKNKSIMEVNEPEETVRKENASNEKNNVSSLSRTKYPKMTLGSWKEGAAGAEIGRDRSSLQSLEMAAKSFLKPYSPFFDANKSDGQSKQFLKQNFPKRNPLELDVPANTNPNDPEVISKLNLEKIYELQSTLLDLAECGIDVKRIEQLTVKLLEMVDKIDYFDTENSLLDEEDKLKAKTYLFAERLSLWGILLVRQGGEKNFEMLGSLQAIAAMTYLNFTTFVDFVMARFVSSYKQPQWHAKFRSLRERKGEKSEAFGTYNNKLIRAFRMQIMHLSKSELLKQTDTLLEKLKQNSPFDSIYICFKKLLSEEIKALKINVSLTEENALQNHLHSTKIKDFPMIHGSEESLKAGFMLPPQNLDQNSQKVIYSLVLDLDETLIHFEQQNNGRGKFLVRPYADIFLKEMSQYYEIIVFTAATKEYADTILNILDKHKSVKHRLYRNHTGFSTETNSLVKDLTRLGRDLNHTIIIDNSPDNFRLQQDNGIEVKSWYSDPHDCELLELMPFLKEIVLRKVSDVRVPVRKLKEYKHKHANKLNSSIFKS